jgi:multiple sugar transport system permease protein
MTDIRPRPAATPAQNEPREVPPDSTTKKSSTAGMTVRSLTKHAVLIIVAVVMIYPLLWLVASSLRPNAEIFGNPGLFIDTFDFSHYPNGWNALANPFSTYLLNSALVVLGCVLGNLISCSLAAYAFARLNFRLKTFAFVAMLVTKFLATDAFFIFLMVQFIRGIPRELDEAARIDGAGHFRIFFQIMLPLMVPALATTAIFTFIWTWNDFFSQLIFITKPNLYTVPVALRSFIDAQSQSDFGALFAMSVISIVPVFLVFLFGQRFLLRGIATTGGK